MSTIFTMREVTEKLDKIAQDYNSLIISAY